MRRAVDTRTTLTDLSVEEFILRLDQLPMELLQIITTFLVPKLEKGQKFWLYDDGRMQCRGQQYSAAYRNMLYEGGKIHSRGQECAAAYQNIHFCFIQGFVEVFHRMIEGKHKNPRVNRVAEKLLAEFLNYVGSNTVVQLKCYESEDHRRPFGSLKVLYRSSTNSYCIFGLHCIAVSHLAWRPFPSECTYPTRYPRFGCHGMSPKLTPQRVRSIMQQYCFDFSEIGKGRIVSAP